MSKIEQNREKKKKSILDAAKTTFLTEGYSSANMDKIAQQANVTKQTLYRYFSSKSVLFEATLQQIGQSYDEQFTRYLAIEETDSALTEFAIAFVDFHLSDEHLNTQRLLIAEAAQSPEIVESFMALGSNEMSQTLDSFFRQRLELDDPTHYIDLWTGMLLAPCSKALLGMEKLDQKQIRDHASKATTLLLQALGNRH